MFKKKIKRLGFNVDEFFHDIHFFFKHSIACREDYASVEVTEVATRYAMQYTETRWLTMKYVAVRVLQQWKNLREYFLKFLPKEYNFKSTVANMDRCKRICAALQAPLTEAYTSFYAYCTTEVEDFLLQFQLDEPRTLLLYFSMCKLVSNLQQKFIRKKLLSGVDSENLLLDIYFEENRKALQFVDIGTKAKSILNEQTHQLIIAQDKLDQFRKDSLNFYSYALQGGVKNKNF